MVRLFGSLVLLLLIATAGLADVPQLMTYQGFLTQSGTPANGAFEMTFILWDALSGGTTIKTIPFPNPPGVEVSNGVYSVNLDVSGVSFDTPYYLEIVINGQVQSPRVQLTSAPYSLGPWSSSAGGGAQPAQPANSDHVTVDGVIYYNSGNVGIGTATPGDQLEITGNFRLPATTATTGMIRSGPSRFIHSFGDASNFFAGINAGNLSLSGIQNVGIGFNALSGNTIGFANTSLGSNSLRSNTEGRENIAVGEATLYNNLIGSYNVAVGRGTLMDLETGFRNTAIGNESLLHNVDGEDNVGVGAGALLHGTGSFCTAVGADALVNNAGDNNVAVGRLAGANNISGSGNVFLGYYAGWNETGSNKLYIANSSLDPPLIYGDFSGGRLGLGTTTPTQQLEMTGNFLTAGNVGLGQTVAAEWKLYTKFDGTQDTFALAAENIYGIAATFASGGTVGSLGYVDPVAVFAKGQNGSNGAFISSDGSGHGVIGQSQGTGRAIWGWATGTGYSGYFEGGQGVKINGNLDVTGTLSKGAGSFKIDHPLDPENKYLYHSFVESPDMMNIYNGIIVLDEGGEAVVEMPEWFESLNRDFRYQLTCIGGFSPVFVSEELSSGRFKIAGGKSGIKISWQVTGIRQDAYANAHRIPVEEDKPEAERGKYLNPDVYGQSGSKSVIGNATSGAGSGDPKREKK